MVEKKAHYPRIEYDTRASKAIFPSRTKSPTSAAVRSHKTMLLQLVEEICAVESEGLKEYSESEHGGRDGIIESLRSVLADLPKRVAEEVADDVVCLPELTSVERSEVEVLEATLATLKEKSTELARYEGDVSELGQAFDMWLDPAAVEKAERAHSSRSGSEAVIDVTAATQQYDQLLADMEARCKHLVQEAGGATKVITDARVAQDELYNVYQHVRQKVAMGTATIQLNPSTDVKSLIRNFPAEK